MTTVVSTSAVPQMRANFCQAVLRGDNDPQSCALVSPGNDIVDGEFTRNGRTIHTYYAPAQGTPKGDIVLVYGFTDSTALHPGDVRALQEMGYNVHSMDWFGQGLSGRPDARRPHIPSSDFPAMIADFDHFIRNHVEPRTDGRPLHLAAHSMGGHLAMRYMHDNPRTFESAVMMAPMLDLNIPREFQPLISGVANIGVMLGANNRRLVPIDPSTLPVANDNGGETLYARAQSVLKKAFNFVTHPTIGWINSALNGIRQVSRPNFQREAAEYTQMHFITGRDDNVVGNLRDNIHVGQVLELSNTGHSPLSDSDSSRNQTLSYMRNVFDQFTAPASAPTLMAGAPTAAPNAG